MRKKLKHLRIFNQQKYKESLSNLLKSYDDKIFERKKIIMKKRLSNGDFAIVEK